MKTKTQFLIISYIYNLTDMLHVYISLNENCTLMALEVNKFIASTKRGNNSCLSIAF